MPRRYYYGPIWGNTSLGNQKKMLEKIQHRCLCTVINKPETTYYPEIYNNYGYLPFETNLLLHNMRTMFLYQSRQAGTNTQNAYTFSSQKLTGRSTRGSLSNKLVMRPKHAAKQMIAVSSIVPQSSRMSYPMS